MAQIARIWRLNYNSLTQKCWQSGWRKEKDDAEVSLQHNILAHQKFMERVHHMMEEIQQGYEDLMMRHQLADTFQGFPFEEYFKFLETYTNTVNSLGGVKPVSQDTHLHLQQNNVQHNVNFGNDDDPALMNNPAVANISNKNAKVMLAKVIENIVLQSRPPAAKEVQAAVVRPEDEPDPARGKYR